MVLIIVGIIVGYIVIGIGIGIDNQLGDWGQIGSLLPAMAPRLCRGRVDVCIINFLFGERINLIHKNNQSNVLMLYA